MGLGSGDGAAGGPWALRSKRHRLVGAADPPSPHGAINTPDRAAEPSWDGIRKCPAAGAEAWVTGGGTGRRRDAWEAPPSHRHELCSGWGAVARWTPLNHKLVDTLSGWESPAGDLKERSSAQAAWLALPLEQTAEERKVHLPFLRC